MTQVRFRQVARLERMAQPLIRRVREAQKEWLQIFDGAVNHAAFFAFIVRYGNPTLDEPLSCAWQRCSEASAWKKCCRRFPFLLAGWDKKYRFEPNSRDRVKIAGHCIRHAVIEAFPGANEKEKLNAVFASAPPWLIWFTFADYTAALMGLTSPDLSSVTGFARSETDFNYWYGFPSGAFERRPWPNGPENEPLARVDLRLIRPARSNLAAHMRPRPIRRPDEWPKLLPVELLEEDPILVLRRHGRLK